MRTIILFITTFLSAVAFSQPTINSFAPSSAPVGNQVVITGSNFNATASNNIVYFGATKATIVSATGASLTVTVPMGATYQQISVLNTQTGLSGTSAMPFTATFNNGVGQSLTNTTFSTNVDFAAGTGSGVSSSNPQSTVIADIDGDGKPDMIAADYSANRISLVRNVSTPGNISASSFAAKVDFTTGVRPSAVAVADLDGDGKLDIIVTNQAGNSISVFLNTSASGSITTASLAAKVDFVTDSLSLPSSVAIADVDGDGKPDIIVTNLFSNTVSVLKNNSTIGSLSFAPRVNFATGNGPIFVSTADVDGDGKPDILIANFNSNTISVLKNITTTGSITTSSFSPKVDFATGKAPASIAIGDLNGDGKIDVVTANQAANTVSVFKNTAISGNISSSSFAARLDFASAGVGPYSVAIGNLDGDAQPDIVVANLVNRTISILKNNSSSSISFLPNVRFKSTSLYPYTVSIADIDGDGVPDLISPEYGSSTVSVFRNTLSSILTSITPVSFNNTNTDFLIYPNPARDFIILSTAKIDLANTFIVVTSSLGQKLIEQRLSNVHQTLSIKGWARGMYYVTVSSPKGSQTQRFIIQ